MRFYTYPVVFRIAIPLIWCGTIAATLAGHHGALTPDRWLKVGLFSLNALLWTGLGWLQYFDLTADTLIARQLLRRSYIPYRDIEQIAPYTWKSEPARRRAGWLTVGARGYQPLTINLPDSAAFTAALQQRVATANAAVSS